MRPINIKSLFFVIAILSCLTTNAQNLLTNGDFESGGNGVGFNINSSFYNVITQPFSGNTVPGNFAVTSNPFPMNTANFLAGTDHSGTGNMLVVDGASTGGQRFWRAGSSGGGACGLTVGTTYTFSFWIKSVSATVTNQATQAAISITWNNANAVTLTSVNTVVAGNVLAPLPAVGWQQVKYTFVATNACVNIEITDNNTSSAGNDFAVDDFSLTAPPAPLSLTYSITNVTCVNASDGTIFGYGIGGITPYALYTLSGPTITTTSNGTGFFTGLPPGSYTLTVKDAAGTIVSQNGIIIPNANGMTLTTTNASICTGASTTLQASGGGTYTWSVNPNTEVAPTGANPTVSPTQTATYTVNSTTDTPNNLIYNGDFFLGNAGFTSDYVYYNPNNPSNAQKAYGVVANAQTWEVGFSPCTDHTTSTGKMMVVDGSTANGGNDRIWCQTIPVLAGTNYSFSYWVQTLALPSPANIEVLINGVSVGIDPAPPTTCSWVEKTYNWSSGASTTAQICIYNRNVTSAGNDFALDDLVFSRINHCVLPPKSITITVVNSINLLITPPAPVCAPGTVDLTLAAVTAGSTAGTTLTYWTDAAATIPITAAAAAAITVSGTYYIKSTLGTCSVIKPVTVTINTGSSIAAPTVVTPVYYCKGNTAVPLTATALTGATLNWYGTNATGGTASATAPTPSTAANGTTTYYVSQSVGLCESTRTAINVLVAGPITIFCDPTQVTVPNSVFFDWNNVPGPPIYHYSYSINGGPAVTGSWNVSHLEVVGVTTGQSVTLTITSVDNYPCIAPIVYSCGLCTTTTAPTFTLPSAICNGSVAPTLPTTSDNSISGTWLPATVSATTTGNYVFTPTASLFPCASTYTKTITVTPVPVTPTLSGTQSVCVGATTAFSSTGTGGTWSTSSAAIATVNASGVVTGVAAGTATITYTIPAAGGCASVSDTRTVTVSTPPSAGTISGTLLFCVGQTSTLSSTVGGGTWSSSNPAVATVVAATGVVTGVSGGNATITYTVTGTCSSGSTSVSLFLSTPITAGVLSGNQNLCVGSSAAFTSTISGGVWTSSNTAIATVNATTGLITGVSAGTVTITYTVSGTGGCGTDSATRTITINAPQSAGVLSGAQTICQGATTTFTSTVAGGVWSSSGTTIATVDPVTGVINGVGPGTTTIIYTVAGVGGCFATTTPRSVIVNTPSNAGVLSGSQTLCLGSTTTFTSTMPGGIWTSDTPAVASIDPNTGVITTFTNGTATITYFMPAVAGCMPDFKTLAITVSLPPSAGTVSGNQIICAGATTTFSSAQPGGTWSTSDATIATVNATTGVVTGLIAGTADIKYTVAGTGGCPDAFDIRAVIVNANVAPTFTSPASICAGSPALPLPLTSTNGITGTWNPPIDNTQTLTYTFTPNAGFCATTTTLQVVVDQKQTPLFSQVPQVCQGAAAPVLPTSSNNTPAITGSWSPAVSTTTVGNTLYTFTPTVGQCVTTLPTTMIIAVVPILTPDFPPLGPFCNGNTVPTLPATSPNGVSGTWSPPAIDNTTTRNYVFTPNPNQCAVSQTLNIAITTRTVPDFAALPAFCKNTTAPVLGLTSPNGITGTWLPAIVDNTTSGTFPYVFTPNATECATNQTLNITVTEPTVPNFTDIALCTGTTAPSLQLTSPNGITGTWAPPIIDNLVGGPYMFTPTTGICAVATTINVTINQYTLVKVEGVLTNYFEDNQVITVLASNAGNYLYQLDYGPYQESPVFENVAAGMHTITVMDANGCSTPLSQDVLVINYPKFFTPNDDGFNDTWNIVGLSTQFDSTIFIYDRYGKLLKEISTSGKGWDGTYNGEQMPSTDYWFTVNYVENGTTKQFKAHFSLKR